MTDLTPVLEAALRTATPLLLAATGEMVSQRAGVLNIGLEGCVIAGAFAAFVVSAGGHPAAGYGAAIIAGVSVGALLALFAVWLRRDQVLVGTALTMLALGATGTLFRARGGSASPLVGATDVHLPIPGLSTLPVIGPAMFSQPAVSYLAWGLVPVAWWWLFRTRHGLAIRAVGDAPDAARAAGIPVRRTQAIALLFGSAMGGLAGGALVVAQAGSFAEGMSAGRGFLAIAIVALGRWHPIGVLVAALVFGAAMAVQFVVQAMEWRMRYELVLMIPYVLTLVALAFLGRAAAPGALARTLEEPR